MRTRFWPIAAVTFVALIVLIASAISASATPKLNGKIAFADEVGGDLEIFTMNPDGTSKTRLTFRPGVDAKPKWSPDGRRIAFSRISDNVHSIMIMDANGMGVRELTTILSPYYSIGVNISWSPDASKIAFEDESGIYTINDDGTNRIRISGVQYRDYQPSFSPDGTRIAFRSETRPTGGYGGIFAMNLAGGDVSQVGTVLQYTAPCSPDWSTVNNQIIYEDASQGMYPNDSITSIHPDGQNQQYVVTDPLAIGQRTPRWSPDGSAIIYARTEPTNNVTTIYRLNTPFNLPIAVTTTQYSNPMPDWQPLNPSTSIVVTRTDDRNSNCTPGDCSLREAVNLANSTSGNDEITFVPGLSNITLTNVVQIIANGTLSIKGPGADVLTITGSGNHRLFKANLATFEMSGLKLTNGRFIQSDLDDLGGGAILVVDGNATFDGVWITSSYADPDGGGIQFFQTLMQTNAPHRILNSTLSGNSSHAGGGAINNYGALVIINSTITGNSTAVADITAGGGIRNIGSLILRNVTITDNSSDLGGGIFTGNNSELDLGNSIIAGNRHNTGPNCYCGENEIWLGGNSISSGGNLIGDASGDAPVFSYHPTDIINTDPVIGPLQNNGGTVPTRSLPSMSVAIDAGVNSLLLPAYQRFDQRGLGFDRVRDGNANGFPQVDIGAFELQAGASGIGRAFLDFDGDRKTDLSIFRPNGAASEWWWLKSSGGNAAVVFGANTDTIVPADYTGDGKTDIAFWRPSNGNWFVLRSEDFSFFAFPFGANGDVPVPADYDGDGKADSAVFRESAVTWFINKSSGGTDIIPFGSAGDKPVPGDFDGDGKGDLAVFRPNGGTGTEWWVRRSSNASVFALQFGTPTDKAVPGDYTGDGKADVAFWRPSNGNWFVLRSEDFSFFAFPFGANGDTPVPGDYDGDGRWDAGVFRPSNNTWFVQRTTAGTLIQTFGITGDLPLPNAYVR